MLKNSVSLHRLSILSVALILAGCSSGSSDSPSSSTTPPANVVVAPPAAITVSGVAASGAAFSGATVVIKDSTGATVGTSAVVGADGAYTVTLSSGAVAPLIIIATRTNDLGTVDSLVSISETAVTGTVNITPVTTLIASRLSSSGDPLKLSGEVAAGTSLINSATVAAKVNEVRQILAPMLAATGTTAFDPLKGTFVTDGTGFDRLLDSIRVDFSPSGTTTTNIEIGIKLTQTDASAQPPVIQFSSAQTVTEIVGDNQITPTTVAGAELSSAALVPSGTSALIADVLNRMTACYALPLATRVDSTASNATGANVTAPACRTLFKNDDPTSYKNNGVAVGATSAFGGLFRDGATGVKFDRGTYEFSRVNGDIVIGYRSTDRFGGIANESLVVTKDANGTLKIFGNQYQLAGAVSAYHQLRTFVNQPSSTYYSTGYNINIPLQNVGGQPVYKVVVTTPKHNLITMIRGSDGMVLPRLGADRQPVLTNGKLTPSGTTAIRMRSEYADTAANANTAHPSTREAGLFFAATDDTDGAIATYAAQSVWSFAYYYTPDATEPDVVQTFKTRARAMTISELRSKKWAVLSEAQTLVDLRSMLIPRTPINTSYTPLTNVPSIMIEWDVPDGALAPSSITAFGYTLNTSTTPTTVNNFSDGANVSSTARSGTILCANGNNEVHCGADGYADNANLSGLLLYSRDSGGREFGHFHNAQLLAP
ncbi:MAG: hypothetical protein JWQ23_2602 [Herminiimonas sp.]|nr:hypothetical protein [Herminiimonas sp.]